jgi:triosephosphate isomerase
MQIKKIIAGNWKMNGTIKSLSKMLTEINTAQIENTVVLCIPFTLLNATFSNNIPNVFIGAQDVSAHESGAYTGEISAEMIADAGAKYVIVGHSERRQYHGETNEIVRQKAQQALMHGLIPIICIGETAAQKESDETLEIIKKQIENSIQTLGLETLIPIVAYEPAWAIGTGLTPTTDDIATVHAHIRKILNTLQTTVK